MGRKLLEAVKTSHKNSRASERISVGISECFVIDINHIRVSQGGVMSPWLPSDWKSSYIVNCYKSKGDALVHGNY